METKGGGRKGEGWDKGRDGKGRERKRRGLAGSKKFVDVKSFWTLQMKYR